MSEPRLRILFLGDICAEPGRRAVEQFLPGLRTELGVDFVIANGENAAAGYGITAKLAESLYKAGVDCLTGGDHIYDRREGWSFVASEHRLIRPLNYPAEAPGHGAGVFDCAGARVGVICLLGRVFLRPLDCPFRRVLPVIEEMRRSTPIVIVDMHAEATAEKQGMGWYLDGQVSAVLGTHTHVQTADERILPNGTAYITDVGMCGAFESVLGMRVDLSLRRMLEQVPVRLHPANQDIRLSGVVVEIARTTGRATAIARFCRPVVLNQTVAEQV
ncbi:MAG: TIGR00282 family metallophosphoesterase [candidate division WOR-3 bacterium]